MFSGKYFASGGRTNRRGALAPLAVTADFLVAMSPRLAQVSDTRRAVYAGSGYQPGN
jgi:hypothetical protein